MEFVSFAAAAEASVGCVETYEGPEPPQLAPLHVEIFHRSGKSNGAANVVFSKNTRQETSSNLQASNKQV